MREVGIERNEADDLLQQQLWEEIWDELRQGKYDVVVVTPPCNSCSRARCNTHATPGPVPVRNVYHPWGFPWLTGNNKQLVNDHNFLLTQCFTTMDVCMEIGCDFLVEHPEDFGVTSTGEHPASVWQLEQMRKLDDFHQATTFAIYQCHFGAQSPKPTRFVTSLQLAKSFPCQGWPQFDELRNHLGPLPHSCSHKFHIRKLIGKEKGSGRRLTQQPTHHHYANGLHNSSSHEWGGQASELCQHITAEEEQASEMGKPTIVDKEPGAEGTEPSQATNDTVTGKHVGTDPEKIQRRHRGQKVSLEWAGKTRELVDGFGLCSPTLWEQTCRGAHLGAEARELCTTIFEMLSSFTEQKFEDPRREAIRLGLGHIAASPFTREELDALRAMGVLSTFKEDGFDSA